MSKETSEDAQKTATASAAPSPGSEGSTDAMESRPVDEDAEAIGSAEAAEPQADAGLQDASESTEVAEPKEAAEPTETVESQDAPETTELCESTEVAEVAGSTTDAEAEDAASQTDVAKRRMSAILTAVIAACLAIAACAIGFVAFHHVPAQGPGLEQTVEKEVTKPKVDEESGEVENPIDFAALQAKNPEIYAWLSIPGTNIDYPVLQSTTDDAFYLSHDDAGAYADYGAIYSEQINDKGFNDPVTVLYGHTMNDTSIMFGTLHYFEDAEFFDEHPRMYIYTPDRILTYEIVSAYIYDDRHIMNTNNFYDNDVVQEYFDYVVNPRSLDANVRGERNLVAGEDHIVQLSTCLISGDPDSRFIVTGVLVEEQETDR